MGVYSRNLRNFSMIVALSPQLWAGRRVLGKQDDGERNRCDPGQEKDRALAGKRVLTRYGRGFAGERGAGRQGDDAQGRGGEESLTNHGVSVLAEAGACHAPP